MKHTFFIILAISFLAACSKEEGEGGKNTIEGFLYVNLYDKNDGDFIAQYPAQEERVYIIYGDESFYGNDIRSNYDGSFSFSYLYKGDYTIFAYSECQECDSEIEAVFLEVELTKVKETYTTDTLFINKYD